jgi:hypothetical protein
MVNQEKAVENHNRAHYRDVPIAELLPARNADVDVCEDQ